MTDRKRRRSGEGSIEPYTLAGGSTRWAIRFDQRDPATGRRLAQRRERGFPNQRAAGRALRDRLGQVDRGAYVAPERTSFGDYLTTEWLPSLRVKPSTAASYRRYVIRHLVPALGGVRLDGVTPQMLTAFYRALETPGARLDGQPGALSPRTVRYAHTIARKALADAVEAGRLSVNPADRAKPPRVSEARPPEMRTWAADEWATFARWSRESGDDLHLAWLLLAATGMRRGELLGLRWRDLDMPGRTLSVRRSVTWVRDEAGGRIVEGGTKSDRARVVALDSGTVAALRAYRTSRAEIGLWLVRDDSHVISMPDGSPRHPERFSREWQRRVERCRREVGVDLPPLHVHGLRHSHATWLLERGEHPKVVAERLGHSRVGITLDVYSHVTPSMQEGAAARIGAIVGAS